MNAADAFGDWLEDHPDWLEVINTSRVPDVTREMVRDAFDAGWDAHAIWHTVTS